jgi:hypothetical protein
MMRSLLTSLALVVALTGCGGGSSAPNTPSTPAPTPTPQPTPTPNPYAAACGVPLPPLDKSYGYKVKVQSEPSPNRKWLTASPLVKDTAYCLSVGQPGESCSPRFEDDPQRAACDHYLFGMSDDNRPGPNWFEEIDGVKYKCGSETRAGESNNCSVRGESQYNLDVFGPGKYLACGGRGSAGTCGVCIIRESDWGYVHNSPAGICKLS